MKIYVTKQSHYNYNYLLNWQNPETGAVMGEWFRSMKDVAEYTARWGAEIVRVNF